MKYELVHDDTIKVGGRTFTRIRALRSIKQHNVQTGDLGGYVSLDLGRSLDQHNDDWVNDGSLRFEQDQDKVTIPIAFVMDFVAVRNCTSRLDIRHRDKQKILDAIDTAVDYFLEAQHGIAKRARQGKGAGNE